MSILIFPPDYSDIYEIANATSVQMSYYYNDIGKLILDVPASTENAVALKNGHILYDTVKKIAYTIKNVKVDAKKNNITANGFTTNEKLNSRVIAASRTIETVEADVYGLIGENLRGLSVAMAPIKGLTEAAEATLYGGELLDEIIPILSAAGLGHRMNFDHRTKRHTFEIYKGNDFTSGLNAVVFSDDRGTAGDLVINDDVSEFKNAAYVTATLKDEDDVETVLTVSVGTAQGDVRHEMWVEFNSGLEKEETQAEYRKRMQEYGLEEIGKQIRKFSLSAKADPSELGVMYDIGDLVVCVFRRYGLKFIARIAGVKYKKDSKSDTAEIILGAPEIIGEV